jgi:hypothetical protein
MPAAPFYRSASFPCRTRPVAQLHPDLPRAVFSPGHAAEVEVVRLLADGLPDAYCVFHGVDWSQGTGTGERHGEVDAVVVNQAGDALLVEVKSGAVDVHADGIFKRYGRENNDVTRQLESQYGGLLGRLQRGGLLVRLHSLLVLTDQCVAAGCAAWPRERIVDAAELDGLPRRVRDLLGPGLPSAALRARVLAFMANRFHVEPDVSALAGRVLEASTRLAAGLATWVPRIDVPSGVVRVVGTAGSGKTQLALRLLQQADARGQRAAYVCFNRALADHMARLAPVRATVQTFHEMALELCRRAALPVDFAVPGAFDALAAGAMALLQAAQPDLDLLVLDEGQDLQPAWVEAMTHRLHAGGRLVLMDDPDQLLYADREPFDLPDAVTVRSRENFRSPRALVELVNRLALTAELVEPMAPLAGEAPKPLVCADPERFPSATEEAVRRCMARGFALQDVAVVSFRGRDRSALLRAESVGPWRLRRFTGAYDAAGTALWSRGDLIADSVRRFKGQAAPAVVFTECDFDTVDDLTRRLLFVGLTRARMHLEWVLSSRAQSLLGL